MAKFQLRPTQIDDLSVAIGQMKSLNLSAPATGKTGPACVFAYYHWARRAKKTWWVMPQSLLKQNEEKLLAFTDFKPEDVAILDTDHAPLTKNWTGPTKLHEKRVTSWRVMVVDPQDTGVPKKPTHTAALAGLLPIMRNELPGPVREGEEPPILYTVHGMPCDPADYPRDVALIVKPILSPDGKPMKQRGVTTPVEVKDLIAASDAKVFLTTFAFLRNHWEHMLKAQPDIDCLLDDEHHLAFKDANSAQTEAFFNVAARVSSLYIMTGSLIAGRLDNAFPAIHAIEPRYYGSHEGFLQEHATFVDSFGRVLGWKNEEKVKAILARHGVCHSFEEIYGEEPVVFFHEKIEVGEKCRTEYDKFHAQAMLELENGEFLDGTQPGTAVIRARQILAHPETMGIAKGEVTGKDQRITEFAAEGQKMILFSSLQPEQYRTHKLLTDLGLRGGVINAHTSKPERHWIDQSFKNGQLDYVVASGPTTAVGYDWEIADHVIYVSPDYQDDNFVQGYRRGSRGTRTTTLRVTSLEYADTIERRQYQILTHKSKVANSVDPSRPVLMFTA